jgi:dipeptidyl aminopeptidase/acylaminoacyl peptidase
MAVAPYGSWSSPISLDDLTAGSITLSAPRIDGENLYWLEAHPEQAGRTSLWRRGLHGGEPVELTPAPSYVRDKVHEYGGGEYGVRDGVVVYSELADGRLYRVTGDGPAVPITPEGQFRYADIQVHPDRDLVLAVREDHTGPGEPANTIVAVELDGSGTVTVLCAGADFYASPQLAADGRLAWTQWEHPNMPWDSTTIMIGSLAGRSVIDPGVAAGGPGESVGHPRWLPNRDLLFVSDRTNWWNVYAWRDGDVRPLRTEAAEYCTPHWTFGHSPYAVIDEARLLCTICRNTVLSIGLLSVATGDLEPLTREGDGTLSVAVGGGMAAAVLSHPDRPPSLAVLDLGTRSWIDVRQSGAAAIAADGVSFAQPVTCPSERGPVHGWFYPPVNPDVTAPDGTLPPLITVSHGGPTGCSFPDFKLAYQFWTSRGYAILDVNYGGSSGFGRDYRQRLTGAWGVVDVEDCVAAARAMGEQSLADPARLTVKGGSAGGFTTLRALTSSDVFAAGISLYGVGDLETLARDTHKFESRYLDTLVGPYPQARDVYRDRSPIEHLDQLSSPILLLQGADDKVVPPSQAEELAEAARRKGLPVCLLIFDGEGHGFRMAETIKVSTQAQIYFLGRILGFTPADDVPEFPIENLATTAG